MSYPHLKLPIGIQDFATLRENGYIYVDKTATLQRLIESGQCYFLARPRRFGKSLTVSTLEAMFQGKTELFRGLQCEAWVTAQAKHPSPVIHLDFSGLRSFSSGSELKDSISAQLCDIADDSDIPVSPERTPEGYVIQLIRKLHKERRDVVVLVDEYDAPILRNLGNEERIEEYRTVLRDFYSIFKSYTKCIRFLFITGISKFSKMGVFSAVNNLNDISMDKKYGEIVGYTQKELEDVFTEEIEYAVRELNCTSREVLLKKLKWYYDGYRFDGYVNIYNPWSILHFFNDDEFGNYWYESGQSSSLAQYLRRNRIYNPETYHFCSVNVNFTSETEIEKTSPESFLYQAGYLTIHSKNGNTLVLDYPNEEIRISLATLYQSALYKIHAYQSLGEGLWQALSFGDLEKAIDVYNAELAGIPYSDFAQTSEGFYRALFLIMLRSVGVSVTPESYTMKGRSDLMIETERWVYVLELKVAKNKEEREKKRIEGEAQIEEKGYVLPFDCGKRDVVSAVIVIDDSERRAYTMRRSCPAPSPRTRTIT